MGGTAASERAEARGAGEAVGRLERRGGRVEELRRRGFAAAVEAGTVTAGTVVEGGPVDEAGLERAGEGGVVPRGTGPGTTGIEAVGPGGVEFIGVEVP